MDFEYEQGNKRIFDLINSKNAIFVNKNLKKYFDKVISFGDNYSGYIDDFYEIDDFELEIEDSVIVKKKNDKKSFFSKFKTKKKE